MKLADVVAQLQVILPIFTDYFSEVADIEAITVTPTEVIIKTSVPHNLTTGDGVNISNVGFKNPIDGIAKDGNVFELAVTTKHDLTFGYPGYETVALGGFDNESWDASFDLVSVPNRNRFQISSANPIIALTGNEYLSENRIDGVNGRFGATVIDEDTFSISGEFGVGDYIGGQVKTCIRIAGSVNIERTLEEYTKQKTTDMWAFVSMHDVVASKDRNAYNDGVATFAAGEDVRLRLIDGFSVFLFANTSESIAAVDATDIFRHDMLEPLLKSLYGAIFDTGLSTAGDFKAILKGHGQSFYNRAILVYQYNFEFSNDITLADSVDPQNTRAFSKIEYSQRINPAGITNDNPVAFPLQFPIDFDDNAVPGMHANFELPDKE